VQQLELQPIDQAAYSERQQGYYRTSMPYMPLVNWEVSSWLQQLGLIELVAACRGDEGKGERPRRKNKIENRQGIS
jgi:hypothetical protein